jgi:hypothetical protein
MNRVVATTFCPSSASSAPTTCRHPVCVNLGMASTQQPENTKRLIRDVLQKTYGLRLHSNGTPVLYDVRSDGQRTSAQVPMQSYVTDLLEKDLRAYDSYAKEGNVHCVTLVVALIGSDASRRASETSAAAASAGGSNDRNTQAAPSPPSAPSEPGIECLSTLRMVTRGP